MKARAYTGTVAFGEDRGTFAGFGETSDTQIALASVDDGSAKRRMRSLAGGYPIIWFVDDERANREWFRRQHRSSFATVTFSRRDYFRAALGRGLPCDGIVTDIFFPSRELRTDRQANDLLAIYDQIAETPVGKLPALWKQQKGKWTLDGFSIAGDGAKCNPPIPVFLFSRKALYLLKVTDLRGGPAVVANTTWLVEKVAPGVPAATARRAAELQRNRIYTTLGHRVPKWKRLLKRSDFRLGPGSLAGRIG